jgi:hypothetical protein
MRITATKISNARTSTLERNCRIGSGGKYPAQPNWNQAYKNTFSHKNSPLMRIPSPLNKFWDSL